MRCKSWLSQCRFNHCLSISVNSSSLPSVFRSSKSNVLNRRLTGEYILREAIQANSAAKSKALKLTIKISLEMSITGEVILVIGEADTYVHSVEIRENSP
ncbi:hypothetical protein D3C77_573290 [compost metagenome]